MSTLPKSESARIEPFIPLCVPEIRGNEWDYVKECLDTNWVSSVGPFVTRFERMTAEIAGTEHAVATMNGTAALHVALQVGGVRPDDEVLVSTLTFIAPANAIRYIGAWPVFIDAEPEYLQMDPEQAEDFLRNQCRFQGPDLVNEKTGRRVSAILPVDVLGHPVDMDPLMALAAEFGLVVVEDATESLGTLYKDKTVGGRSDIACLSFNGNKIITTGGGGMLLTSNADWAARARHLTTQAKDPEDAGIHREIGYNYRLTSLQAAMGCAQLEQLDDYVEAKRAHAMAYDRLLDGVPGIRGPSEAPWARSIFWLYTILVDEKEYGIDNRRLQRKLRESNIDSRPLWQPIHLSPAHAAWRGAACPVAESLYAQGLSLPSSVGLTDAELARVAACVAQRS